MALVKDLIVSGKTKLVGDVYADNISGTITKAKGLDVTSAIGSVTRPVYIGADGKPSAANTYPTFTDTNSTYKMVVASTAAGTTSTATTNGNTFVNVIENGSTKVGGMKLVGTNIGITATSDGVITFSTAANPTSVPNAGNADTVDSKHASDFAPVSHTHATSDVTSLSGYSYVASQTGALATSDTLNVALAKLQAQVNTKATTAQASAAGSSAASAVVSANASTITSSVASSVASSVTSTVASSVASARASAVTSTVASTVASSVAGTVVSSIASTVASTVASARASAVASSVTSTVASSVTSTVASAVTSTVASSVAKTVASAVASSSVSAVVSSVASAVTSTVASSVTSTVASTVASARANTVASSVASSVTSTVASSVTSTVASTVASARANTVASSVASTVASSVTSAIGSNHLTSLSIDGTDKTKVNYYNGTTSKGNFIISSSVKAGALSNTAAIGGASQPVYFGADGKPSAANTYPSFTDTKVTQTVTTANADYPLLFKNTVSEATVTEGARFGTKIKVNPSTGVIQANAYRVNISNDGSIYTGMSVSSPIGVNNVIRLVDIHTDGNYGPDVAIGAHGATYIGAGESLDSKFNEGTHNDENVYLVADTGIKFYTGGNTYSNIKETILGADGILSGTFKGNLTGTAASATTCPNYLPLSGGTMTGAINLNYAAPAYSTKTPSLTKVGTAGTKNTNTGAVLIGGVAFKDSAGNNLGIMRTQVAASGAYTTTHMLAYAPDTTSTASLAVIYPYNNGAPYATAPTYTNYTHSGTVIATTAWVQEAIKSNTVASASNAGNVTGVVPIANGGTGNSTAVTAINALINSGCSTGTTTPTDPDYYICQYVGGGTSNTNYYRRPHSALYAYIQGKTDSRYLKLTGGTLTGNLTVTKANTATSSVEAVLNIGNNIADGTSGANAGILRIYGSNANFINFDVDSPTRSTRLHIGDISDGLTTGTGSGIIPVYSRNTTTLANGLGSTDTPVYINSAGVIKECTGVAKALRVLTANKTIYVSNSSAGTDTNDGSTTSKPMSVAAMWKYLRETAIDKNGYTLTICFNATGTSYGDINFHENNCPYIRTIVITTSGTISPTPTNYSPCAIFGNITVSGNVRCTISNIVSTGAITATFGGYIIVKDYIRAYTFRSNYYSYLGVTGSSTGGTVLDLFNANVDCAFRADNKGYIVVNSNYVVINFNGNCNYTTSIFSAQSTSKMTIRWSYIKFTGTKPTNMSNFTSTLTGTVATAAGTAAKAVTLESGQTFSAANLSSGAVVYVEFNNNNTAANPTLNVNATGAKPIYSGTAAIPAAQIVKGVRYKFTYNGSQWVCGNTSATAIYRSTELSHFTNANGTYASTYNSGTFNFSGWASTATGCGVIDSTMTGTITSATNATNATSATTATKWNGAAKTVATGAASGGASGDIWFQYIA